MSYHALIPPTGSTADIQAAVARLAANGGGVLDLRSYAGTMDADWFADHDGPPSVRMEVWTGPTLWEVTATSYLPSHTTIRLFGTRFLSESGVRAFDGRQQSIGANCTAGSDTVTPNVAGAVDLLELGDPVVLFGHLPRGGKDTVALDGAHTDSVATLTIVDTTGLPDAGVVRIEDELIAYTGRTGTTLTGCTRGARGTTAASYSGGEDVDRVVYESFVVTAIGGSTFDIANPGSANPTVEVGVTGTQVDCTVGPQDIAILGHGTFDGGGIVSAAAFGFTNARHITTSPDIHYVNFPSHAQSLTCCRNALLTGSFDTCGNRSGGTGHGQVVVGGSKHITIEGRYRNCHIVAAVDDRSVTPTFYDNPNEDFSITMHDGFDCTLGPVGFGSRNGFIHAKVAANFTTAAASIGGGQWLDNSGASEQNTTVVVDIVAPAPSGGAVVCQAGSTASGNTVISRTPDITVTGDDVAGVTVFKETTAAHLFNKGLTITGALTTDGGLQTFGANDSGGSGLRAVVVPNV